MSEHSPVVVDIGILRTEEDTDDDDDDDAYDSLAVVLVATVVCCSCCGCSVVVLQYIDNGITSIRFDG